MRLILDFGRARQTACHCYTGVHARINEGDPVQIVITPDGCRTGIVDAPDMACGKPTIDHEQAWSIAMLLTGREEIEPCGEANWDQALLEISVPLKDSRKQRVFG